MNQGARLRQRLQWPRPVLTGIDVLALGLSIAAVMTSQHAMRADSDTPFIVAQVLSTAAIPLTALALVLSSVRIGCT